uniref:hypothetical protein n=1 Tax=Oculatella sp. LEGE 06141 TaxID=1828648 RepID=UPI00187EAF09
MMKKRSNSADNPFIYPSSDEFNGHSSPPLRLATEGGVPSSQPVLPLPEPQSWRWLLLSLAVCGAASGMAVGAFLWLIALPPATECQKISTLSPDRDRLYCAQTAADSGELPAVLAGIDLVEQWTPEHALYPEAQQSLTQWSNTILNIAREQIHQNDLESAIAIVEQIPPSSPAYEKAQATLADWKQVWQQGRAIDAKAQEALQRQDWEQASQQILALSKLDYNYWRSQQTAKLSQQIVAEQQAQTYLVQARSLANSGTPDQVATAIKTAAQINRDTYVWKTVQPELNQWSDRLLSLGVQQWKEKNFDRAIALGRQVSPNPALAKEAQNLIWLAESRQQAIASLSNWTTSADQVWHLVRATAIASQISPDSRFHPLATASMAHWQTQLQDLTQLHVAQLLAQFKQVDTLNLAIDQAQMVTAGRPRRVQAQTLVAYWSREIERLEDQPYLAHATQLAASGTVPALRQAIATAKHIAPGRVLRTDAQGLIATWQKQIERIQDQPYLDRAQRWAAQGELAAAIDEASAIQPGRALYRQAQGAIDSWRSEIRVIERAQRARRQAPQTDVQIRPENTDLSPDTDQTEELRDSTEATSNDIIFPSDHSLRLNDSPLPLDPPAPRSAPQPIVSPPLRLDVASPSQPEPEEFV